MAIIKHQLQLLVGNDRLIIAYKFRNFPKRGKKTAQHFFKTNRSIKVGNYMKCDVSPIEVNANHKPIIL